MQDDGVLRHARRIPQELHRLVEERLLEGATSRVPGPRQLRGPAGSFVRQ